MTSTFQEFEDGNILYGDDFDQTKIAAWFADEEEGYAGLVQRNTSEYRYAYHQLNRQFGFRHLELGKFRHALGFGAAYGDELQPIADQVTQVTILDPSDTFSSRTVLGIPSRFVKPDASGRLAFADNEFDLVTCFGVLHHIPNVSYALQEIFRCLEPGGKLLVREPIVSMGNWDLPRPGLTKRERGIPKAWLTTTLESIGFQIDALADVGFRPFVTTWNKVAGSSVYESRLGAMLDGVFSRCFRWNYKYHTNSFFGKFRPTSLYLVLSKPTNVRARSAA